MRLCRREYVARQLDNVFKNFVGAIPAREKFTVGANLAEVRTAFVVVGVKINVQVTGVAAMVFSASNAKVTNRKLGRFKTVSNGGGERVKKAR